MNKIDETRSIRKKFVAILSQSLSTSFVLCSISCSPFLRITAWRSRRCQSTIDLTFETNTIQDFLIIHNVRQDLKQGSDHLPICTLLDLKAENTPAKKSQVKKTASIEKISKSAEKLETTLGQPTLGTRKAVHEYLHDIMRGLDALIQNTVPWVKPSVEVLRDLSVDTFTS